MYEHSPRTSIHISQNGLDGGKFDNLPSPNAENRRTRVLASQGETARCSTRQASSQRKTNP